MIFGVSEAIVGLTLLLFFLCGAAWSTNRRIPLIAMAVIVSAFLVFVGAVGIWAARCWECLYDGGDLTRGSALVWSLVWAYIPAVLVGTGLIGDPARLLLDAALRIRRSYGPSTR